MMPLLDLEADYAACQAYLGTPREAEVLRTLAILACAIAITKLQAQCEDAILMLAKVFEIEEAK